MHIYAVIYFIYAQTVHGDPEDGTKHVGDLGILEFSAVPDDWPASVERCNEVDNEAFKYKSYTASCIVKKLSSSKYVIHTQI